MTKFHIGIDISKAFFDVSVVVAQNKERQKQFKNDANGFASMEIWLRKYGALAGHFCMEATGAYWIELATFLHNGGAQVSVVNPACIKRFAQSELKRTKTDKVDAGIISRFCKVMEPGRWSPPPAEVSELQALYRRHHSLINLRQQERNRAASEVGDAFIQRSIKNILSALDIELKKIKRQIERLYKRHADLNNKRKLLTSIPGVGEETAMAILAEVPALDMFESAKQLAAFAGVTPREVRSGTSIRGRARLSKIGNARLRHALYMPTVVAKTVNPTIRAFFDRLKATGKPTMKVLLACMRKLFHLIFGVLKSGKPYDPGLCTA